LPYFVKEARFDMIQDFEISAMRDDEWVFSGYSFTDQVWIDQQGKLHEGKPTAEQADNIWGVGFYHEKSRDAFIALWLDHASTGLDSPKHNGSPSLHYEGHGQLWARYPARQHQMEAGSSIQLRNAYLTAPYPEQHAAEGIESLRHELLNPLLVRSEGLPEATAAQTVGELARPGETAQTARLKPAVWRALNQVRDEQLYQAEASIVDLGYVYDLRIRNGAAHVLVTMPHRGRPVFEFLVTRGGGRVADGIREHLLKVKGIDEVVVDFTWDPAWSVGRVNATGRRALGLA
jgi:metal-sulfur cluster biosynthetic enzyme